MTTLTPPYALPDLRPFRAIQNRMRIQGGSVITGNGVLQSENYDGTDVATGDATEGYRFEGSGDAELNGVRIRGDLYVGSPEASLTAMGLQLPMDSYPGPGAITWYDTTDDTQLLRIEVGDSAPQALVTLQAYGTNFPDGVWFLTDRLSADLIQVSNYAGLQPDGGVGFEAICGGLNSTVQFGTGESGLGGEAAPGLLLLAGSASSPGLAFMSAVDTGLFLTSTDQVSLSGGGAEQLRTGDVANPGILVGGALGTTLPHVRSVNDPDTGMLFLTTNQLVLQTGGNDALGIDGSQRLYYYTPNTTASAANLFVTGTGGQIYRSTSSRRIKKRIRTLSESVVDRLRPVTFQLRKAHVPEGVDPSREMVGLIAEEVAEADPRLAQYDEDGEVIYFDTNGLIAHLIAAVQTLQTRVEELEAA